MSEVLQYADQYYVLATSILADHETRVLKHGETFAVFDPYGDIEPVLHNESGIFHRGTRHLSRLEFKVFAKKRPLLLNSILRDDNGLLKVDMTTSDQMVPDTAKGSGQYFLQKGMIYVHREKILHDSSCQERVEIFNYAPIDVEMDISFGFAADFADIFEVRGTQREKRGKLLETKREKAEVVMAYEGLDGIRRFTRLIPSVPQFTYDSGEIQFRVKVPADGSTDFSFLVVFGQEEVRVSPLDFHSALKAVQQDHESGKAKYCEIKTANEQFDNWLRRSTDDLVMMTTETEQGCLYPYAGIPWFCAPFGRDGIITALQCLWANPMLAKGVLQFLARMQATEHRADLDATPGKILHEMRQGEMAALKEIPFGCYYGSIDSTPLFVCLAGQYYSRTGDKETIEKLWPSIEKALFWIDRHGDIDGDGFVEYQRENPSGLIQQGWKDSHDSVFHADRNDAPGPIALAEVQGYVYMAKIEGAKIAKHLGRGDLARDLEARAQKLKEQFEQAFWLDEQQTFALALDGKKKPCRIRSSNAGQCLFTGIVSPDKATQLVKTLMHPDSYSGWGIRTVAKGEARYNPMSYHNGSVWPHDVSLVAWGMSKMGFTAEAETLFNGMFKAATYMELLRLPEVFCGFPRREGEAPTLYPNACAPQAWASATVYMMLQSILGLSIDALERKICFAHPRLPESLASVQLNGLEVADRSMDVQIRNFQTDVGIQLGRRDSSISVVVVK